MFLLILFPVFILLVMLILKNRSIRLPGLGPDNGPSALEILDRRYARGDIDLAAYQAMKKDITVCSPGQAHGR
jgi:uncharacterized membrane protein